LHFRDFPSPWNFSWNCSWLSLLSLGGMVLNLKASVYINSFGLCAFGLWCVCGLNSEMHWLLKGVHMTNVCMHCVLFWWQCYNISSEIKQKFPDSLMSLFLLCHFSSPYLCAIPSTLQVLKNFGNVTKCYWNLRMTVEYFMSFHLLFKT
jgi:hypothetical protein